MIEVICLPKWSIPRRGFSSAVHTPPAVLSCNLHLSPYIYGTLESNRSHRGRWAAKACVDASCTCRPVADG